MEFLLTRNCAFVTSNYYIENGYTERRTEIVRAASCKHSMKEMEKHFSMINGLGPKHTYALKAVLSQLNE
jgi:hypothetical protein